MRILGGIIYRHYFAVDAPEVKEIDLNPIYAYARGAVAVDARVVLEEVAASV
jgi:hypothetical protein